MCGQVPDEARETPGDEVTGASEPLDVVVQTCY